jgi:hypothetical protein
MTNHHTLRFIGASRSLHHSIARLVTRPALLALAAAAGIAAAPALASSAPAVGDTATTSELARTTTASSPYCGIWWGSLAKSSSRMVAGPLTNVRAGRHTCFDRLVIDLTGPAPGYDVRYVSNVYADGSGALVPLRGGAKLQVVVRAPAYTSAGAASYLPANPRELVNVSGYSTFRQVAWAGSFEGQTTIGLGVRARLPFRVFTLPGLTTNTSRLVVDVAHRW